MSIVVQFRLAVFHCLDGGLGVVRVLKVPLLTMLVATADLCSTMVHFFGIGIAHDVVLVDRHRLRKRRRGSEGSKKSLLTAHQTLRHCRLFLQRRTRYFTSEKGSRPNSS